MNEQRIAAFVEYVLRPLSEDWRVILEQVKSLDIGLTQETIKVTAFALGLWHLGGEIIRAVSYILITWLICQAVVQIWPLL
jgi:hypothetical protein